MLVVIHGSQETAAFIITFSLRMPDNLHVHTRITTIQHEQLNDHYVKLDSVERVWLARVLMSSFPSLPATSGKETRGRKLLQQCGCECNAPCTHRIASTMASCISDSR